MPELPEPRPETPQSRFIVERYEPGLTLGRLTADEPAVRRAAGTFSAAGRPVLYLGSTLIPAEETAFYAFEAGAIDWVEEVSRSAGLRFDRIVEVVESRESERDASAESR